jgi:hypothetical protein
VDQKRTGNNNHRRIDLELYVTEYLDYKKIGNRIYTWCPFHTEKTPSCVISKNSFYCFGCGEGGNVTKFLNQIDDTIQIEETVYSNLSSTKKYDLPSIKYITECNNLLLELPDKLDYLESRFVDLQTVIAAKIGYVTNLNGIHPYPRYVIPFWDSKLEKVVSIRYRIDPLFEHVETEAKYISHYNCEQSIYNIHVLDNNKDIIIVGSQFDAAFLHYKYGLGAIAPPSENVFKQEWVGLFRDKNVLLWLDNDLTGYQSMVKAYNMLYQIGNCRLFVWKKPFEDGDDFTDFFKRFGERGLWTALEHHRMSG